MNISNFSRRDLEFKLHTVVNQAVPKLTKLKTPTKVHYDKMRLLAEKTEAVVKGECPNLKQLSIETGQPVLVQTRLAKSHRLRVGVNFRTERITLGTFRDLSATNKKRPVDDATPHMLLNGAYDYVREENAKNILNNKERLEKIVMINAGRLERYKVVTAQDEVVLLKPLWHNGSPLFFKLNGVGVTAEDVLYVDVVHNKLWKYDREIKGYECDKYFLVSEKPASPDEIPLSLKKALLMQMV